MNDKLPEEAEHDIRRNVARHYDQVMQIEQLKTEVTHWQSRAKSAEREAEITARYVLRLEEKKDQLLATIATLKAQFDVGAQCWLNGYEALRNIDPRIVPGHAEPKKIPSAGMATDGSEASSGGSRLAQNGGAQHAGQDGRHADREDRQPAGSGDDEHRPVPRGADDAGERPGIEFHGARSAAASGDESNLPIGPLVQP